MLEKDYCQTLSLVVNRELSQHKTRLIRDNLPLAAARLQNVFIESFPTAILAVHKTILTREPNRAVGADQLHVPTLQLMRAKLVGEKLKGTRYSRSTKSLQYRRHIPREAKRTVEAINKLKTKRKKKRNEQKKNGGRNEETLGQTIPVEMLVRHGPDKAYGACVPSVAIPSRVSDTTPALLRGEAGRSFPTGLSTLDKRGVLHIFPIFH